MPLYPASLGYALFDTALGVCAVAFGPRGICGVSLPENDEARTEARIAARFPLAKRRPPTEDAALAIEGMTALLAGEQRSLREVALDETAVSPFHRRVYAATREIPPGRTRTYGEIARAVQAPQAARAIGRAMGQNPFPIVVPCHRVVGASGQLVGFSAHGGLDTKRRLLRIEQGLPTADQLSLLLE